MEELELAFDLRGVGLLLAVSDVHRLLPGWVQVLSQKAQSQGQVSLLGVLTAL